MSVRAWPTFHEPRWSETRDVLHVTGQFLGKLRTAVAPPLPQWFHSALDLSPRGLTTRALPLGAGSLEVELDVLASEIRLVTSDGRTRSILLLPARPIATLWGEYVETMSELGVDARLSDRPQERGDSPRFRDDHAPRDYDPELAAAWFAVMTEVRNALEAFRSRFFGRSIVGYWWGGFDITAVLHNGRRIAPREGADFVMRNDLDAEHLTVGFWPGDATRDPMFFGYVIPEPSGCPDHPARGEGTGWSAAMGEWVLPYEVVRRATDRRAAIGGLLETVWRAAGDLAGWDLADLAFEPPARR